MTSPSTPHTLSIASVNLILFAARQRGADPDALARSVGLDPARLGDPDGRIPIRQVQDLWRELVTVTGDPNIALKLGEMINPVAVGVLAYVMMHCPTLGKALDKLCEYQDIVCEGIQTVGRRDGNEFILLLYVTSPDIIYPTYALNSELAIYQSAFRALTGRAITANEISFGYPRPVDTSEHERVFAPARLTFDADCTTMTLDASLLDIPILNANPSLFPLFEQHANALLQKLPTARYQQPSLAARVKGEIIALLKGEEPTLATVADRLAMGVRTLQLHLKDEGVTYQQLLDDVRRDLAVKHLREANLSTTDIAYLLGFAEPSVFFRSFKKWTGVTPGAFRLGQVA
ncbi:AraC family transcriptional regulator [Spirosoma taeanense]|uniref:AraC family transcriptional regulator n=1 Tax=Spirosoma taeanense TaxID=2735870 RepID=A0A6M5Y5A9_9BACT|nr:AraC family transcriptional regulator [Spirosoma taeanense]QJW88596.1 AraC family transcriptional regulator [Spirosoma taeanense]